MAAAAMHDPPHRGRGAQDPLTPPAEAAALAGVLDLAPEAFAPAALRDAEVQVAAQQPAIWDAIERGSVTTEDAAALLRVSPEEATRLARDHTLYAVTVRGVARFPTWQFVDGQPLPHLREVMAALPSDAHPLAVATLMTTTRETLGDKTPAEWLAAGADPAPVVGLADELAWV